jgi:hypothetical protein
MNLSDIIRGILSSQTTGFVGGPVDIINEALGGAGLPVSNKPVMGSKWLNDRLGVNKSGSTEETIAELLGGLATPGGFVKGLASAPTLLAMTKSGGKVSDVIEAQRGAKGVAQQLVENNGKRFVVKESGGTGAKAKDVSIEPLKKSKAEKPELPPREAANELEAAVYDSLKGDRLRFSDVGRTEYDPGTARANEWRKQARERLSVPPKEIYTPPQSILLDYSSWKNDARPDMSAFSTIGVNDRLPRAQPKGSLGRVPDILRDDELHDLQVLAAKRGQMLGGDFWYNLMPIYQAMREAGGTDADFARFVANNYAFSSQTPVMPNIAHATLASYMAKKGILTPDMDASQAGEVMRNIIKQDTGKSAKISEDHLAKAIDFLRTGQLTQGFDSAQKFSGYGHGLAGFRQPVALDTHEVKFIAESQPEHIRKQFYKMVKDKKTGKQKLALDLLSPNEYAIVERLYQDKLAPMAGVKPADFQANRWLGGGEITGLVSPPIPHADATERLLAWNAMQRGIDPRKLRDSVLLADDWLRPYNATSVEKALPMTSILLGGR